MARPPVRRSAARIAPLAVIALALAPALPGAANAADPPTPRPRSVETESPANEPILSNCLVSLVEEAKVPAREAGVLVDLVIREGDTVARGAVIARIDDSQPQSDRRKARAEYEQAVAKAENDVDIRYAVAAKDVAEAELEKAINANRTSPGAITEIDIYRLRLNQQKSELSIEQARLEQRIAGLTATAKQVEVEAAGDAIARRLITAPLDGVVVEVFPHRGEWMQPGDPLARVVRADTLRVEGYVNSARHDPAAVRDRPVTVDITLADQRVETFPGRIVFTSPIVESGGEYRVWAEVTNRLASDAGTWLMRPGQTARMTIHSNQPPLPPVRREVAAPVDDAAPAAR
ncbi:MAG: HlyD family efflux transporter periplasmic adaptor subunit [Planctomycetes bacterium]|nr:HlyD family efflux transporter periplasmic adaptor subunit [Planctomycetota bacterium]